MASTSENELKMLMKARAGVWGRIAEILEEEPSVSAIDKLLSHLDDLFENVEFTEGDHLTEGYAKLKNWRSAAEEVETPWLQRKLAEEYASLFLTHEPVERSVMRRLINRSRSRQGNPALSPATMWEDGPCETALRDYYSRHGYSEGATSADPYDIFVMADFLRYMAELSSEVTGREDTGILLQIQDGFMKNVLLNDIPDFCKELYEKAPEYGIYQYVALVLHGFANFDTAIMDMALKKYG